MVYQILIEKQVEKYLRKLPPKKYQRLSDLLHSLKTFPAVHVNLAPLKGAYEIHSYRLRHGDLRILFTINKEAQTISIWKIDTRGDIY